MQLYFIDKNLTARIVGGIKILRIDTVQLPHALRQVSFNRFHQGMMLIIHQTIGMTNPIKSLANLS